MALTNSQYDEIIRSYNRQEFIDKHTQSQRIEEIYSKIPRIKEINDSISSISLSTTRMMILSGNDSDSQMDSYRNEVTKLRQEKADLLKKNGFPKDYLDMHYKCPDCKDTGFIGNERCHCFKKAAIDLLYKQSNLESVLHKENFSTFKIDYFNDKVIDNQTEQTPRKNMEQIVAQCRNFIDNFGTLKLEIKNLLIYGKTGVGKTFLTHCIAKELIDKTFSVIYLSSIDFFTILSKAEFSNDTESKIQRQYFNDCDLLIIDDLGTEIKSSFISSAFFNIINERQSADKSTIISSNLGVSDLMERYSERIASRLAGNYMFLKVIGDDLRCR